MRRLTIVFFEAGGGHRSAAEALNDVLQAQTPAWEVSLLNLQELLDRLDVVRNVTGMRLQDAYNLILRRGWTRLSPQMLVVLQGIVRFYHARIVKVLKTYWAQHPADLVLSVIPHFNRAQAESIRAVAPEAPFVTLLTDFADYPPHFWIEPESQYIIVGTDRAKQQAIGMGHPASRIFETSGMILKPRFYQQAKVDRVSERQRLGLDPDRPTAVVLFGGHGSRAMVGITKRLDQSDADVQLILLCGHNQKLAADLKALQTRKPIFVEGFTQKIDYYMALADFFIGKPGPGSISEALQFHLPVVVECNSRTLPQERYNTEWLIEKRCGIVLDSFRNIASGVQGLLEKSTFDELRLNASRYSNRALFEVPVILEKIAQSQGSLVATASPV